MKKYIFFGSAIEIIFLIARICKILNLCKLYHFQKFKKLTILGKNLRLKRDSKNFYIIAPVNSKDVIVKRKSYDYYLSTYNVNFCYGFQVKM